MCSNCGRVFIFRQFDHELIPKKKNKKKDVELKRKRYLKVLVDFLRKYVRLLFFTISSYLGVNYLFVFC